jgi:thiamine-phosphate pyrophosphorylase
MSWKDEAFQNFKLYAVTDLTEDSAVMLGKIESAYEGGADIVQLRSKTLSDKALYEFGRKVRLIADRFHKLLFVNDRPNLAIAIEADGVHLGQEDIPVAAARALFAAARKKLWIGKSTHSIEQGLKAAAEGPDYIGVGPVYSTPTKPGYQPAGLAYVQEAARQISLPFVAIGGIDQSNAEEVLSAGARRIAVVRAIFSAENVCEAARKLRETIESHQYV